MNIREITESIEQNTLSDYACKSNYSRGRKFTEEKCDVRTDFQRDRDRIIHSKAFRRLKHKTQVFLSPEGDHYRTRLTHTLEVAQISRTIARALRLNEDLTEAIALGHDLGHTPFGHCGEHVLNEIHSDGFRHNEQSLRVVDKLEKRGYKNTGLNLTYEVRDGILNHTGETDPSTLEGQIVKLSDRIAYINHDIDDAIRARVLKIDSLPKKCTEVLGFTHRDRINTMIRDVINKSFEKNIITMSDEIHYYTNELRNFMFEYVYLNKEAKKEEEKAQSLIIELYNYFCKKPFKLPREIYEEIKTANEIEEKVKDYIAGMSDRYAVNKFLEIYVPKYWV
ncbi:deoxyguanosinetriphosphate triphosphohydrolase [Paramaledivibacter caminithermalis]|jgi:dGTPase|uniref:Deoxyguanosinetriphosphate triphosphohydrolase-like protein n=1 Tax=Paramaledivibacter caminithermalis (strain DSM 15212 / CIP 107654 / DViRD3) TaxID=1121301 RepID=A0A1M6M800_PARC5|nr:deoxyguanosinetriphosphate triphosphohydrolase [Paramaledivibacter caminithermalis]SHJ79579.1 dGTPase [Paramaledivibacter caminithermalis DSM 15212]